MDGMGFQTLWETTYQRYWNSALGTPFFVPNDDGCKQMPAKMPGVSLWWFPWTVLCWGNSSSTAEPCSWLAHTSISKSMFRIPSMTHPIAKDTPRITFKTTTAEPHHSHTPVPPTIQLLGVKGPRNLVDQGANKKHQMLVTCPGNLFKPIGSMYGIFTYIWLKFMVNVGKDTIHRSCGKVHLCVGFF